MEFLLLLKAEVLPQAADGGLDPGSVLIVGGGGLLPGTGRLPPQAADSGRTQRSQLCRLSLDSGHRPRKTRNLERGQSNL